MPYQQTATPYVVRLVALRGLSPARLAQCQAVRAEAGRLWTDLLRLHTRARARALAERGGIRAGDQGWAVCAAPPERAGAVPD